MNSDVLVDAQADNIKDYQTALIEIKQCAATTDPNSTYIEKLRWRCNEMEKIASEVLNKWTR